ncbi:hypothetical protein CEXT_585531 [Caerostris extrusa]|uniref:Uncharacterized protein n=1 Tax=Caerostris extrusa TaxID=172846 RepID=A0AAV4Y4V4_CAEEX|nr:hypothetical protein CEXT_585531 [Caerostris extrusa]
MFPSVPSVHLRGIKPSDLFPPLCFVIPPGEKSELFFVGSPGSKQISDLCAPAIMVNETFLNYDDQMQLTKILARIKTKNCDTEED